MEVLWGVTSKLPNGANNATRHRNRRKEMKAFYFRNTSNEDFTHAWDSVDYTVKAGQEVLLQSFIAIHLAKHLAMREMGKRNKNATIDPMQDENGAFTNAIFSEEIKKYLSEESVEAETPEKLEVKIEEKKRAGRPKKEVEEEFPDLKSNK